MNPLYIAQSKLPDIDPAYFLQFLACVVLVMMIVALFLNIRNSTKVKSASSVVISPDPLRTQKVQELATKGELEEMTERIESDLAEVKDTAAETVKQQHGEVVAIHNRINKVAEGLEAIRGQLTEIATNQRLLMNKFLK
jgi:vacuolar-type H+-ATPase subunit C/Vma6